MRQFEKKKNYSLIFFHTLSYLRMYSLSLAVFISLSHYFVNKQTLCLFVEVTFPHVNVCSPMVY